MSRFITDDNRSSMPSALRSADALINEHPFLSFCGQHGYRRFEGILAIYEGTPYRWRIGRETIAPTIPRTEIYARAPGTDCSAHEETGVKKKFR